MLLYEFSRYRRRGSSLQLKSNDTFWDEIAVTRLELTTLRFTSSYGMFSISYDVL